MVVGMHSGRVSYWTACIQCTALHCAPEHDCLRNWYDFSKAMEPDVVVSMAKSLQQEGIKLGALVADDVLLL